MSGSFDSAGRLRATVIGLAVVLVSSAVVPAPSDAAPTASITLNQTEFRAGDTLTVGLQIANPADGPQANRALPRSGRDGRAGEPRRPRELSLAPGGADHNLPFEFTDTNGFTVTFAGETSPFGIDDHNGYDFRMAEGTPILAAAAGTVTFANAETPFVCPVLNNQLVTGLGVVIRHAAPNGQSIDTSYAHMSRVDV